jgi:hypothetical protein
VRGEAVTAAVLGEAVARAGGPVIDLNLASARADPRRARARELARSARADLERVTSRAGSITPLATTLGGPAT